MIKAIALGLAAFLLILRPASGDGIDPNLDHQIRDYISRMGKLIDPKIWSMTQKDATIVFESKSEMAWTKMVSPALGQEPIMARYRLTLSFEPYLPREQYLELVKRRMPHLMAVGFGYADEVPEELRDGKYAGSHRYLEEHPLPSYRASDRAGKGCAVYRKGGMPHGLEISRDEDYFEAKRLDAVIERLIETHQE